MNIPLATYETRNARLSQEFGRDIAWQWFGLEPAQLLKLCGPLKSGKNKGQPRGAVWWLKCTQGGWDDQFRGVEKRRGTILAKILVVNGRIVRSVLDANVEAHLRLSDELYRTKVLTAANYASTN